MEERYFKMTCAGDDVYFILFCDSDVDAFGVDEDEEMRCIKIQEVHEIHDVSYFKNNLKDISSLALLYL